MSEFIDSLIDLALIPFGEGYLFLYCAGFLCVGMLFRTVYRLMHL